MVHLVALEIGFDLSGMDIETFAYGFKTSLPVPPPEAAARVTEALASEGFGVLTEIDIEGAFREKLGVDFGPYVILGACNPPIAHQALSAERDIGVLLPCNVAVYQGEAEGNSVVVVLDPVKQLSVTGREDIEPLAQDVASRLRRVLEAL